MSPDGAADTAYMIAGNNIQGAVADAIAVAPGGNRPAWCDLGHDP